MLVVDGTMARTLAVASICLAFFRVATSSLIVETPSGRIDGWESTTRDGRIYQAWTRIPYAKPPIGELRLKVPHPMGKWNGTLNATRDAPYCFQMQLGVIKGEEDCLYLNVFRPKVYFGKLPVLVFVHGGSFQTDDVGPRRSAEYLMDEDVILVQISYRLNGFGFMTLGDQVLSGNIGLKDQTMALRWVKENIAAFDGDPNLITIFGGSAGGASTHLLLKSPLSEGLVTHAVSHSGTINRIWSLLDTDFVKKWTLTVVEIVGCNNKTSEGILLCLQSVDRNDLIKAIAQVQSQASPIIPWVPVIEPKYIEGAFATEDLSLKPSTKPWITSFSNGEYILILGMLKYLPKELFWFISHNVDKYLESTLTQHLIDPIIADEGASYLESNYFSKPTPSIEKFSEQLAKMHQDDSFVYPAMANIERHVGPKWLFRMEYKGELSSRDPATGQQYPDPVAGHDSEKFYYFNYRSRFNVSEEETPQDYAMSKKMIKYLVNFAYYGDPTPPGASSVWNQYGGGNILRITRGGDFIADGTFLASFRNILNVWSYYMGWK